ncbi:MAG TPA: hypothetical protein VGB17_15825 [Pyrinomonadaceae bacterium]|jgi:predicted lipid-binding transport protein (Tim44 family)
MLNWQAIAVALIILAATTYVARRAWSRLRAFRAGKSDAASCATGCGSCSTDQRTAAPANTKRTVFVEIGRTRSKT